MRKLQRPLHIFLWLAYVKSEVELWGKLKVIKGKVAEETVVERSINKKDSNRKND